MKNTSQAAGYGLLLTFEDSDLKWNGILMKTSIMMIIIQAISVE